jgi:hypothetical protein
MPDRQRVHYADGARYDAVDLLPVAQIACRVPAARYGAADRLYPATGDTNRVTCGSCRRLLARVLRWPRARDNGGSD